MRRWFVSTLFAFALCACLCPAFAAVETGGVEYVWYTGDAGLYISADCGASYGVLPELEQVRKRTGLAYVVVVTPTEQGGLAVKGRDIWSTEYTWFQEYSAAQLSAAVKAPVSVTPVEVHATNGTVTVGSRYVMDEGNDDLTRHLSAGNLLDGEYAGDQIVYSLDGVTWQMAQGCHGLGWLDTLWWDGEKFQGSGGQYSADGVHWENTQERKNDPSRAGTAELGRYRFEIVVNEETGQSEVYLMERDRVDTGVLLPHMGEAMREKYMSAGTIRAWYGPGDTVNLAVYDRYQQEKCAVCIPYPISSLDWCLENLSKPFRAIETLAFSGEVSLGMVAEPNVGYFRDERALLRNDGSGWKPVTGMDKGSIPEVLPLNGKTFLVQDRVTMRLYASEDGLNWTEVGSLKPEGWERGDINHGYGYINYSFAWTGKEYIACRKAAVGRYGMMGTSGGQWYEGNTKVYFLTGGFDVTGSYDFGRLVEKVGYAAGAYYAQVGNSTGNHDGFPDGKGYDESLGSTLYRSTDGKTWTALPDIYMTIDEIWQTPATTRSKQRFVAGVDWGMRASHLEIESTAVLDDWRFFLTNEGEVYLLKKDGEGWANLPHLGEAARQRQLDPASITAVYNSDGTVKVELADRWTPALKASMDYPVDSLDWVKENLGETWREDLAVSVPEVADLVQRTIPTQEEWTIQTPFGEADASGSVFPYTLLLYRGADTGGEYRCYENAPWGSTVQLLPFSGKDFMAIDVKAEKLFLSSDGVTWREAAGDWITGIGAPTWGSNTYSFVWTGQCYLVCCTQTYASRNGGGMNEEHQGMVYLLDEDLDLISSTRLDVCGVPECNHWHMIDQVGYRDGVCYAQARTHMDEGSGVTVFRSADGGVTWEKTDVAQVRTALMLTDR